MGQYLDPIADKLLLSTLFVVLTHVGMIPRYVTVDVQPAAEARIDLPGLKAPPALVQAAVAMTRGRRAKGGRTRWRS